MSRRVPRLLAATILVIGLSAAIAGADADPASDVLLGQNVFYPYDPAISASLQNTLNAETSAAVHAHFPLKVALIGSPQDLGAIPIFFDKPQQYAHFLHQEISFQGKQPLLVVMPDGYGVQGLDATTVGAAASLARPTGTSSDDLARAAITAVQTLAAAAGHPIKAVAIPSSATNSGSSTTLILLAIALTAVAAAGTVITLRDRRTSPVGDSGTAHAKAYLVGGRLIEPRLVVGALLICGGVVWAIARGLRFYGINLAYDLDQPPLLLLLVGAFLLYRSRLRRGR